MNQELEVLLLLRPRRDKVVMLMSTVAANIVVRRGVVVRVSCSGSRVKRVQR